ncbi:SAM-dependent methyltransferase [Rhodocista pekingensis]|uniref:SAM-dependent methyltransferase n=1 Tax=Rhodocista pekingensis TaxID=201185 RepID=A0ABW2KZD8_9PROT
MAETETPPAAPSPSAPEKPRGSLTVVGTGLRALSHMTLEAVSHIRDADRVFFSVPDGVTARQIRDINPEAVDLTQYYGEDKRRKQTYVQMSEVILREVRAGSTVTAVFYGHPGFFVFPARRILSIARKEGYRAVMLPGISSLDCLMADLRVDPSVNGCQILEATDLLLRNRPIVTSGHVIILQVGSVGDSAFSFTAGFRHAKRAVLFERLIEAYGEEHRSVLYLAATYPGLDGQAVVRPLGAYRDPKVLASVPPAGTLYIPAKDMLPTDMAMAETLGMSALVGPDAPVPAGPDRYGPFEEQAIAALEHYRPSPTWRPRTASKALQRVMTLLAGTPSVAAVYRKDPARLVDLHPDLTPAERKALLSRRAGPLNAVTAPPPPEGAPPTADEAGNGNGGDDGDDPSKGETA